MSVMSEYLMNLHFFSLETPRSIANIFSFPTYSRDSSSSFCERRKQNNEKRVIPPLYYQVKVQAIVNSKSFVILLSSEAICYLWAT